MSSTVMSRRSALSLKTFIFIMTDYIRRVVSGNKARFKDDTLGLELGL